MPRSNADKGWLRYDNLGDLASALSDKLAVFGASKTKAKDINKRNSKVKLENTAGICSQLP